MNKNNWGTDMTWWRYAWYLLSGDCRIKSSRSSSRVTRGYTRTCLKKEGGVGAGEMAQAQSVNRRMDH